MQATNADILLAEDSLLQARAVMRHLSEAGFTLHHVGTGEEAVHYAKSCPIKVVVLDLMLPDLYGVEVLKRIKAIHPESSIVIITNNASVNSATEAMKAGAFDFIVKPFGPERLLTTVRNAYERFTLKSEVARIAENRLRPAFHGFIGSSAAMNSAYQTIENVARSRASVFITGESGTGKELCAEAIHAESPRGAGPFVAINCAAIPAALMESEIFGHVKGAFTGATQDREGAASRAAGGTLFLDEVCELPLDLQPKLLRLLQTGSFQRVGSSHSEHVDIRIISATNRDPFHEVAQGRFREDLFFRLHVVPLKLPALRERGDDVIELAKHYLARFAAEEARDFSAISPEALERMRLHPWPGNVRELQNVIRNAILLNDGPSITGDMLKGSLRLLPAISPASGSMTSAERADVIKPLWQVEQEAIAAAIQTCNGNLQKAAAFLEISLATLYRKKAAMTAAEQKKTGDEMMKLNRRSLISLTVAGVGLGLACRSAAASSGFGKPSGDIVLTISGKIGVTNSADMAVFDIAMLESMPKTIVNTTTPWTSGKAHFEGVLLSYLLDLTKASGSTLVAGALNDYSVNLPVADAAQYNPIIAYKLNGAYMPVREKGPLWIMYPFDSSSNLKTETIYSRAVWQLQSLVVS